LTFGLCLFTKEPAKGLALYDEAAAARNADKNVNQDIARVSIVAKGAMCRGLGRPEVLTWGHAGRLLNQAREKKQTRVPGNVLMVAAYPEG
jgi:hypothetical protein